MFDATTGEVNCVGVVVQRGETLEQFLATDTGRNAQLLVENDVWTTYRFSPDEKIFLVLQFKNGVIEQIRIAHALEGDDPDPWTVESETARKSRHDQMLRNELGTPPYRFNWGQIESITDPKNGASQIVVNYA